MLYAPLRRRNSNQLFCCWLDNHLLSVMDFLYDGARWVIEVMVLLIMFSLKFLGLVAELFMIMLVLEVVLVHMMIEYCLVIVLANDVVIEMQVVSVLVE